RLLELPLSAVEVAQAMQCGVMIGVDGKRFLVMLDGAVELAFRDCALRLPDFVCSRVTLCELVIDLRNTILDLLAGMVFERFLVDLHRSLKLAENLHGQTHLRENLSASGPAYFGLFLWCGFLNAEPQLFKQVE